MIKALGFLLIVFPALALAQDQAAAQFAAGCGPDQVQFDVKTDKKQHSIPSAGADKAVAVVFEYEKRDTTLNIGGVTTRVGLDGKWIGANHGESYFSFPVDPGEHRLCANWQSSLKRFSKLGSAASFTAEPGKVYFFRVEVEMREHFPPAVKLTQVDSADGQFQISSRSLSTSHVKEIAENTSSN